MKRHFTGRWMLRLLRCSLGLACADTSAAFSTTSATAGALAGAICGSGCVGLSRTHTPAASHQVPLARAAGPLLFVKGPAACRSAASPRALAMPAGGGWWCRSIAATWSFSPRVLCLWPTHAAHATFVARGAGHGARAGGVREDYAHWSKQAWAARSGKPLFLDAASSERHIFFDDHLQSRLDSVDGCVYVCLARARIRNRGRRPCPTQ